MMANQKSFIFCPEIPFGSPRNVASFFFFLNYFFSPEKNWENLFRPHASENTGKRHVWHLLLNFVLFKSHHANTLFWAQEIDFKKFARYFSPFVIQWINFQGDGNRPKITKTPLPKILNLVYFSRNYFFARKKHRITCKLRIPVKGNVA